jgi:cyclase
MKRSGMKRSLTLGALLVVAALSMRVAALQQPAADGPKIVEVEKLKDNLYLLKGGGGNTAVFIGTGGVTVVDAKNPGWGEPLIEKIKGLTNKPITTLINTHTHGDHVSGNVAFAPTVDIIVQANTKVNMEKMPIFKENNGRGMAKRIFTDQLAIGAGNDRIELYYFGRGHTNGDAWVVFPALRFVHAGDIFSGKNLPLLDPNNGGSGLDIGDSLAKAADRIKNVDSIITGHSTVMNWNDLREYAQFNKDFRASVEAGLRAGKSVDDIAAGWKIADKYKGYNVAEARVKTNVTVIANELKK